LPALLGRYTGKTDSFVELKTSLVIRGPHDEGRFEKYGIFLAQKYSLTGLTTGNF
jgi:hypothetical protein